MPRWLLSGHSLTRIVPADSHFILSSGILHGDTSVHNPFSKRFPPTSWADTQTDFSFKFLFAFFQALSD